MPLPLLRRLGASLPLRLGAFYFAYFAYAAAMVAYFPPYLSSRGLDAGEIALVVALPQLARIFAPTAWGWLADRTGAQRGIVAFSCAVMAVAFPALALAHGVGELAVIVALMSVLSAGALPIVESLALASLSGAPGRYGPIRLWGSIGFILVVLGGGAWLDAKPVESVPIALGALALAALAASAGLPRGSAHARLHGKQRVPSSPAITHLLAAGFCMAAAHGVLYGFLTLHLQRMGYSGAVIGMLWSLGVVAEIAIFLYLPAIFRRYSLAGILLASLLVGVARFLAIGWLAGVFALLLAAQVLHAITFGAFHAASIAAVHRVFPASAQGLGQTLFSSLSYGAGGAAGALAGGWGWERGGPALAFSLAALATLIGAYFAYRLKRAGL
ncbi:MAG TPA: MFS transporter [Burkholderiales bacterium]|nr:MFS transporter [Burkholderiales bacterium]